MNFFFVGDPERDQLTQRAPFYCNCTWFSFGRAVSLKPPCSVFIRPVGSMLVVEFWHAQTVPWLSVSWVTEMSFSCKTEAPPPKTSEKQNSFHVVLLQLQVLFLWTCSCQQGRHIAYWSLHRLIWGSDRKHLSGFSDVDSINGTLDVTVCETRRRQTGDHVARPADVWRRWCSTSPWRWLLFLRDAAACWRTEEQLPELAAFMWTRIRISVSCKHVCTKTTWRDTKSNI